MTIVIKSSSRDGVFLINYARLRAAVAQSVERIHGKDEVSGSIPDRGSRFLIMFYKRLIEVDALRGLAVLGMVCFHALFDAQLVGLVEGFQLFEWPWVIFSRSVQFLFLGLVGVSVYLSSRNFSAQLKRGSWIFSCGLLVSVVTYFIFSQDYVRFGVLQFIGLSIPILFFFKWRPYLALLFAVPIFILGEFFLNQTVENSWLLWLGLHRADFSSLDYFPLLPWLSAPLVGVFVGSCLYAQRQETALVRLAQVPCLVFMGRHALAIYLLHQPVLYFSLWWLSYWIL